MKKIKKIILYIIIFIGTIAVLSKIPSNFASDEEKEKKQVIIESESYSLTLSDMSNRYIYCYEMAQTFKSGTYNMKYKFIINPDSVGKYEYDKLTKTMNLVEENKTESVVKYGQGLGKIFSYINSEDERINKNDLKYTSDR